jgi:hypothetical protein
MYVTFLFFSVIPRSVSFFKKQKECLEQENAFVFRLSVLGKSIKNVRDLIKKYQIESNLQYLTSHCDRTFLSVSGNVSANPSEIPHCNHSV